MSKKSSKRKIQMSFCGALTGLSGEPFNAAAAIARMGKMVMRGRALCKDGTSFSAQANAMVYCFPRDNNGPYESVEIGMPSVVMEEIMPWAENPTDPTGTIYARVPVNRVAYAVARRGGRDESDMDYWEESLGSGRFLSDKTTATPCPAVKPRILQLSAGRAPILAACEKWAQKAVLGSPAEELAARFEIRDGRRLVLDFYQCLERFSMLGHACVSNEGLAPWAESLGVYAEIEKSAGPAKTSKSRKTL